MTQWPSSILIVTRLVSLLVFGTGTLFLLAQITGLSPGESTFSPRLSLCLCGVTSIGFVSSLIGLIEGTPGSGVTVARRLWSICRRSSLPSSTPILSHTPRSSILEPSIEPGHLHRSAPPVLGHRGRSSPSETWSPLLRTTLIS